jgi:hypothetical protein
MKYPHKIKRINKYECKIGVIKMRVKETINNAFLSLVHFYSALHESKLVNCLNCFNKKPFVEKLKKDFNLSNKQIDSLLCVLILKIFEYGYGLPKGYFDLYKFADRKGLFEI